MKIAFLGSRGIPACYSGFETFVEQISVRLVRRGHDVTVYNRIPFNRYRNKDFNGVRIVRMPTISTKATDTIVHTGLSVIHALSRQYDIIYFCGVGNSLFSFIPKLRKTKTVVNVDGADFERAKWTGFGRWWLRKSEQWASRLADVIIADNGTIQRRYRKLYGVDAELIPYGANVVKEDPGSDVLSKYQLTSKGYFLYVSRLTPENAADLAIRAHIESKTDLPLVVVGDAPYQHDYIQQLRSLSKQSSKVILTGYLFGEAYRQLSYHARAFILPTAIEATRPVLLDQMAFGSCIIVRNTPGNMEVVGDAAIPFSHETPEKSLADLIRRVSTDSGLALEYGKKAQERVAQCYDWEVICSRYESLFVDMLSNYQDQDDSFHRTNSR